VGITQGRPERCSSLRRKSLIRKITGRLSFRVERR
jgi:hypothetical protein